MEIKVFLDSRSTKPIFQRVIYPDDAVVFDFNLIYRSMKLLFGADCIVVFKCV